MTTISIRPAGAKPAAQRVLEDARAELLRAARLLDGKGPAHHATLLAITALDDALATVRGRS